MCFCFAECGAGSGAAVVLQRSAQKAPPAHAILTRADALPLQVQAVVNKYQPTFQAYGAGIALSGEAQQRTNQRPRFRNAALLNSETKIQVSTLFYEFVEVNMLCHTLFAPQGYTAHNGCRSK